MEIVFNMGFREYDERRDAYDNIRVLLRDIAIKNLGITREDYSLDANVYKAINSISLKELEEVLEKVEDGEKNKTRNIQDELKDMIYRLEEDVERLKEINERKRISK